MKNRTTVTKILLVMIIGGVMFGLFGCGKEKYKVTFENEYVEECFEGLKDSYAEGSKVKIYYGNEYIGTDSDYRFYLDNERLDVDYSEKKGYIITFKMPAHDVLLTVNHTNSMFPVE